MDPPDPMPNSVVKRNSADGSVGPPHVRVGHRQASNYRVRSSELIKVLCAGMAQLVERTLGKGEVPSSNLGTSTINLFSDHSTAVPPDPMPNSEVKRCSADGSVGPPHVRVGHR